MTDSPTLQQQLERSNAVLALLAEIAGEELARNGKIAADSVIGRRLIQRANEHEALRSEVESAHAEAIA